MSDGNIPADQPPEGEFLLYQTEDGRTRIECRLAGENIWLTQRLISELFQTSIPNINQHLKAIYEDGELSPGATIKKYLIVQTEGKRQVSRPVDHYSLDAILAVGYRVRSHRGTQFRIWATERLREYLVKGFAMDDDRLKQAGGGQYFEELLTRIRDIRSSERVFWRKVLDIYATSVDYDPAEDASTRFFKMVQNKMHWAAHGHTAAEIVHERADASRPNMGLTSWSGDRLRKTDVAIAKNYLNHEEIEALNRIVTAYLEFAELQALNRNPMTMADWIAKLDDFLKLSDREILDHAGKISHEDAKEKAETVFETYQQRQAGLPQPVDEHFAQSIEKLKQIEKKGRD
ncbi:MAG: virulence RhuM family protein [Candidatus Hydrogenedentes bacterium]|nr:virulence RhuM family protein [Candidatus Hydrogenedentota bacterium]